MERQVLGPYRDSGKEKIVSFIRIEGQREVRGKRYLKRS
jgi:urease beta subunit